MKKVLTGLLLLISTISSFAESSTHKTEVTVFADTCEAIEKLVEKNKFKLKMFLEINDEKLVELQKASDCVIRKSQEIQPLLQGAMEFRIYNLNERYEIYIGNTYFEPAEKTFYLISEPIN